MASAGTGGVGADRLLWVGWTLVFVLVAGLLQVLIPSFFDGDTGYHLAVARLTREYGILHAFPWTPFSWLDANYADKEFVFHLLLVPLTALEPVTASRIAGTVLGALLLVTVFALLRVERVPNPGFWALLPLAASSAFVVRFAMVRPHLLSMVLALCITWAAVRRRPGWLAGAAFLYPLCYTAWHLPVILVGIVEGVRLLAERRIDWRMPVWTVAALAVGIVVHPNFPETAQLFWIQNAKVLFETAWSGVEGIDLGGEFEPFSALGMLRYLLLPAALAGGALVLAWPERRRDIAPAAFSVVAVAFLVLTLRTQRFVEYAAPFAVVAAALAVGARGSSWRPGAVRIAAPALVVVGLCWTLALGRQPFELLRGRAEPFPRPVAELLGEIVPPGAQVVTCDWRLTGEMMLALPERRFMVALDPVFFAVNDPERYRIWYETVNRPPEAPAVLLRDTFDAHYVLCGERERWRPFHEALERDPAAALRGVIGLWRVYQLRPPDFDPERLSQRS
jgi:hypothetical protein